MLKISIIIWAFILTFFGVEIFRRWSLQKEILDLPNERSSHSDPTPVGGGLIIVIVSLLLYIFYLLFGGYEIPFGYFTGAAIVVIVSWLDDLYSLPAALRLAFHSLAAVAAISSLDVLTNFYAPFDGNLIETYFALFLLFIWIVWMINAYNFMDGIDGIAALQAVTAGAGWILIADRFGAETTAVFAGILAASGLGFLLLNWQPAKIFMGDVGSAFFGYTFAVLPLLALKESSRNTNVFFIAAVLLVWLFVFDTLTTVLIRIFKRKKIWEAHREHSYQKLVIRGYSHQFVAILYGFLSVFILGLLTFWFFYVPNAGLLAVFMIILLSVALFAFGQNDSFLTGNQK